MSNRISAKQEYVLSYVANNIGCNAAEVTRALWGGRGHAAEYLRINRLLDRGLLRYTESRSGRGNGLRVNPTL